MRLLGLIFLLTAGAAFGEEPPRENGVAECLVKEIFDEIEGLNKCTDPVVNWCFGLTKDATEADNDDLASECYVPYSAALDATQVTGNDAFWGDYRKGASETSIVEQQMRMSERHVLETNELKCRHLVESLLLRRPSTYGFGAHCAFLTSAQLFRDAAMLMGDDAAKWLLP